MNEISNFILIGSFLWRATQLKRKDNLQENGVKNENRRNIVNNLFGSVNALIFVFLSLQWGDNHAVLSTPYTTSLFIIWWWILIIRIPSTHYCLFKVYNIHIYYFSFWTSILPPLTLITKSWYFFNNRSIWHIACLWKLSNLIDGKEESYHTQSRKHITILHKYIVQDTSLFQNIFSLKVISSVLSKADIF